jgi:hypothetical protein
MPSRVKTLEVTAYTADIGFDGKIVPMGVVVFPPCFEDRHLGIKNKTVKIENQRAEHTENITSFSLIWWRPSLHPAVY